MQYITKENLPVFKYVNILPAEFYEDAENDLSLLMEYHERLKSGLTNGDAKVFSDKSSDDVHRLVMKCFDYYPKAFFSDGPGQQGILSKIKEKITKINPETGNENLIGIEMFTVIGLCIRLLNIITFTRILQGAIFDQGEDPFDDPVGLIMNEEGKLLGLTPNRALKDNNGRTYDIIFGDFLVTGLTEENFGSLSDELIEKYTKFFYFQ